jgi:AraC family transcriptional regulator of adaptative response/methylated-DNA-[protein]-cysteine methyltransferase
VAELHLKWPQAAIHENPGSTRPVIESIEKGGAADRPLSLFVSGTNFQINVWHALLRIPSGRVVSYGDVAKAIGHPRSARAVGNAIGMNPVALLIPCHRVIAETGQLAGYRWGEDRKQAILTWEIARHER